MSSVSRQPELDVLRGAAAMAVVMFHYFYKGPSEGWIGVQQSAALSAISAYGYLGVHLFFMISGYVIMMTAQAATFRQFVASRVSRLLPALWVCASLTTIIEWLVPSSPFKPESWWQYLANLTLVPGLFGQEAMDGAYWSLAVEITFYAWVAFAIGLGLLKHAERLLLLWLLLSLVNYLRPMYPVQLFTSAHWAPLFSAGAFFFFVRQSGWTTPRRLGVAASALLACLYALREAGGSLMHLGSGASASHVNHIGVMAIVLSFFVVFFVFCSSRVSFAESRWSLMSGRLTYPLYLLHQNIGYALFGQALAIGIGAYLGPVSLTLLLMALSLAAAFAINVLVERRFGQPLRRWIEGN